jgi:hypothetical protein
MAMNPDPDTTTNAGWAPQEGTAANPISRSCPYCEPRCPYCGRKLEAAPRPYPWLVNPPIYPWPATPWNPYGPWITWTYGSGSTSQAGVMTLAAPSTTVTTMSQADLDYARSHPAIL